VRASIPFKHSQQDTPEHTEGRRQVKQSQPVKEGGKAGDYAVPPFHKV
jgi:hypothetical protein